MFKLYQVTPTPDWWIRLNQFPDRLTYHTEEWIRFIAETQNATPVFADVYEGSSRVGCFHSLVIRRFGLKILASPFPGWTTEYMGFNLMPGIPRWLALQALEQFAFRDLGCVYVEVADRAFTLQDGERAGFEQRLSGSYESDLTKSEEELFRSMDPCYRRRVRKAARLEVVIEEAPGDDLFVTEYYEQLKDVFRKQGLIPTYSIETVRKFVQHLYPTGRLGLLRARNKEGKCIATAISHGMHNFAQVWGCASFRESLHLSPNQALHWYALRYWRNRGAETFDWGGGGKYKEQYGCREIQVIRLSKSRIPLLSKLRDQAQSMVRQQFRVRGWWKNSTLNRAFNFSGRSLE
jgi:Acetyltransferase (GNAT) domain